MAVVVKGGIVCAGFLLALAACGEAPAAPQAENAEAAQQAAAGGVPAIDLSGVDLGGVDLAAAAELAANAEKAMGAGGDLSSAKVLHYTVVGVNRDKHVQIPAADADQYGDVVEKVTLGFDWDVEKQEMIGAATITNTAAVVSNMTGMGGTCPAGEMKGAYEHFDAVDVRSMGAGALEVVGVRKHPDTMVAESCGAGRKLYKAADKPVSTAIGPPDPGILQMLAFAPPTPTIKLGADGKSVVVTSLNDSWEWTYTPTVK